MIPETFNSTVNYMYPIKWSLDSLLPSVIGAFIGAFLAFWLRERNRRKREHFARLNDKIYEPCVSEIEERYEFGLVSFDPDRLKPKIGHAFLFRMIGWEPKKYFVEEIEKIFRRNEWLIKYVNFDILKKWEGVKKNLLGYEKECVSFFEEIKQTASERAQLPFYTRHIRDKFIDPLFVEHIYNKLVLKVGGGEEPHYKGSPWYKGFEPSIKRSDSGIYELRWVEHPPGYSVYATGSEEEMKNCKNIFKELVNYPRYKTKAESLIKQAKEIENKIKLMRDKIGEIMDLEKL